ncbi:MAG: PKD domain-containing protein [Longimicrobiales bacterium]
MRKLLAFLFLALVAACDPYQLQPLPLEITVTPERTTAAPGDSIMFTIDAQGGVLLGIDLIWGDGQTRTIQTSGARTANVRQRHAYAQPGVYEMSAAVSDAEAGSKTAAVSIRIQ